MARAADDVVLCGRSEHVTWPADPTFFTDSKNSRRGIASGPDVQCHEAVGAIGDVLALKVDQDQRDLRCVPFACLVLQQPQVRC